MFIELDAEVVFYNAVSDDILELSDTVKVESNRGEFAFLLGESSIAIDNVNALKLYEFLKEQLTERNYL